MILGPGPVVIGRGDAFDRLALEACRALHEDGLEVVVVDSNASGRLTDQRIADRTYVEPLTAERVTAILERERPDAVLPTLGGPDALALALALSDDGTLRRLDVELVGTSPTTVRRAREHRESAPPGASATGWKQFQAYVVSDVTGDPLVWCLAESLDPVGVHPDDAMTVAPAATPSGGQRTRLCEAAVSAVRAIGLAGATAEARIAMDPRDGRVAVLGIDTLVTRGAAFASMATGTPIARIAARLAIGDTSDAVRSLAARGWPRPDHCTVKLPRWVFDRFPEADPTLTDRGQSVGDAIGIGRTFKDALHKAVRAVDGRSALTLGCRVDPDTLARLLRVPTPDRLFAIADAYREGWSTARVHALTRLDPWFLEQVSDLVAYEDVITERALGDLPVLRRAKRWGFADARIADLAGVTEPDIRALRRHHGLTPAFRSLAGSEARTRYSTYDEPDGAPPLGRPRVMILAGPDPTAGLDDAATVLDEAGLDAIVVGGGDEAGVRVYPEPLTLEDVLGVVERERPLGVIVEFGGPVGLALARPLAEAGVRILGTRPDAIECAGDRARLQALLAELGLEAVPAATARGLDDARAVAARLGYPVLVRSGDHGRPPGARVVHDDADLQRAMAAGAGAEVRVEKFLEDAIQVAVDAVSDGREVFVAGVMEHVEKAGVHAADAACVLPPYSLDPDEIARLHDQTAALARALGIVGLLNVRFALKNDTACVLAVDPGASRTVPFVSRAVGISLVRLATHAILGGPLPPIEARSRALVAVREAVFPFEALAGVDVVLGPAGRATGAVMGLDRDVRTAYLKAQLAAGGRLPRAGKIWISVRGCDRRPLVMLAKRLGHLGFSLVAAGDSARVLRRHGLLVEEPRPAAAGPDGVADLMRSGEIVLAIDVPDDGLAGARSAPARREALRAKVPHYTTLDGAQALVGALEVLLEGDADLIALQDDDAPAARRHAA